MKLSQLCDMHILRKNKDLYDIYDSVEVYKHDD